MIDTSIPSLAPSTLSLCSLVVMEEIGWSTTYNHSSTTTWSPSGPSGTVRLVYGDVVGSTKGCT